GQGWPVVARVSDDGVKGDSLVRPGLTEVEAIFAREQKAGRPVSRLLVWHPDRLSRADTLDAFALLARLRERGLRWAGTHGRTIDLYDPLDRTLLGIQQDHQSHVFLKKLGADTLRGMHDLAAAGHQMGRAPLGYRKAAVGHSKVGEDGKRKRRRSGKLE